jgi:predicted esterase
MCQQERKQRKRLTKTIVSEVRSEVLLTKSRQFSRTFFDGLSNGTIFFHYVTKRHEVASAFKFGLSFLNVMIQQLQAKAINIINTRNKMIL